ncbi:MAG: COX15/CtaA family protein [Gammaproteobacteria bacterium]
MHRRSTFALLARVTFILAFVVVVVGAYVRLSDAGLGCPDWPGCYGPLFMADVETHSRIAADSGLMRPYEHDKAWKEMIHRYLAGFMGLLILALAVLAWQRRQQPGQPFIIALLLPLLVAFQAALGMWTVTLLLKPAVVLAHLLGGMTILSMLWWLVLRSQAGAGSLPIRQTRDSALKPWVILALVVVFMQIMLGGWVSTNYAALVCADFPTCRGQWWPDSMDFHDGFTFWRGLGVDYEGGVLSGDAMTAVHVMHRLGALVTLLVVGGVAVHAMIRGSKMVKFSAGLMLAALALQIVIGIANIYWMLPLWLAVAHNAGAALLLMAVITLLHQTSSQPIQVRG